MNNKSQSSGEGRSPDQYNDSLSEVKGRASTNVDISHFSFSRDAYQVFCVFVDRSES